ncbi:DUF4314 domain-containing protein [Microbacterium sp. KR10-403]|uniref:DUF4314 domain-containing protein n=1 Tax=Microbacterium sp. KR10-403 TaxID=3158581 RepID=UPI0032E41610
MATTVPSIAVGSRVRLIQTSDPHTRLQPGEEGTVAFIDSLGTFFIDWENGSSLGLIPGEDSFEAI